MKHLEITIDKNVPIPARASKPKSPIRLAMEKMKVGESFQIPRDVLDPQRIYGLAKIIGIKVATREVNCQSRRIWRVK